MGAVFSKAWPTYIDAEGDEFINDPDDPGGRTKYGITQLSYPTLDIAKLDEKTAQQIIERDYWLKYRLNEIDDQIIATRALLLFVNLSPDTVATIIQKAINVCGRSIILVKVDGVLGSETIRAINSLAPNWVRDRISIEAIKEYMFRARAKKEKFLKSWVRRSLL